MIKREMDRGVIVQIEYKQNCETNDGSTNEFKKQFLRRRTASFFSLIPYIHACKYMLDVHFLGNERYPIQTRIFLLKDDPQKPALL